MIGRTARGWAMVMSVGLVAIQTARADEPAPVNISKVDKPLVIDGKLDEPAWQKATPVEVKYVWGKTNQPSGEPRMLARFCWDDQYLYIGYEAFDENLVAAGTGEDQGPAGNRREVASISSKEAKVDVVEFFVSFGDEKFFWELHHNALNQFSDIWCSVLDGEPVAKTLQARFGIHFATQEFVNDDKDAGASLSKAVQLKPKADGSPSTINDSSDKDTGYTAELRLPWFGLGAPLSAESWITIEPTTPGGEKKRYHGPWKLAGSEIMVHSVFQNGDLSDHYHHSSPTFPGSWFHKGSKHWPRYRLVDEQAVKDAK